MTTRRGFLSQVGQAGGLGDRLTEPDGAIYLAGDHVSHLVGWQEGAALSAHLAISKIDQASSARPTTAA